MSFTNSKENNTLTYLLTHFFTKSTRFLGLFLVATLFLFSCGKEEAMEQEVITVPFAGTWKGTVNVSGVGTGTVAMTVVIREDGNLTMDFTPLIPFRGPYTGKITEEGILEAGRDTEGETTNFTGTLDATRGAGDWDTVQNRPAGEASGKGRWSIEKEE